MADVPDKRIFKQRTDLTLGLPTDAPLVKRYGEALKALISDMRRKGTSSRQITLEHGQGLTLDGRENGYQFPYEEDADLFEGASVVANVGGRQSEGRIIAVTGRQLLISLGEDFGPRITLCIIRVDNTAMLEALRSRLEKILGGEVAGFNTELAEAVMRNDGDELPPTALSGDIDDDFNTQQRRALTLALSNHVLYIWGPPGTGKTKTLSALCLALFRANKRVLLCSNTNQAVDQVLLKLCKQFSRTTDGEEALNDGSIVRLGKIALRALNSHPWDECVTLEGIVGRRSVSLRTRKLALEEQLDRINRAVELATEISGQFERLDELIASEAEARQEYDRAVAGKTQALLKQRTHLQALRSLEKDIGRYESAGTMKRLFLAKPDDIRPQIQVTRDLLSSLEKAVDASELELTKSRQTHDELSTLASSARQKLGSYDRGTINKQIAEAEAQKQPVLREIGEINRQLEDILKAVVDNARLVGATVTKAYLSPQMFGNFDVVVVDEASMVLLPAMYYVAGLAKESVIVSGDFRQLSPIITTSQKAILDEIGSNVFRAAHVDSDKSTGKRCVMLDEQYRMDGRICALISRRMYGDKLKTRPRGRDTPSPPTPFDSTLTIVDTSPIYPFVNRDPLGSRFNLMNALAIRNFCLHLKNVGYLVSSSQVGVCTPYAAQTKVLKRLFAACELDGLVESGTVHRYQGDEKTLMVLDIPDSLGEPRVGVFLEADDPSESGAMLFNVAVSRAKAHLIIFANLDYLDKKLPPYSFVRDILWNMQSNGSVIDVRDVLALYPVMTDLRKYGRPFDLSLETHQTGLFSQTDFQAVCHADMERARKGVAIFSGFVTPQRVASYEGLFRSKRAENVPIRCVTRPPDRNGSIPIDQGRAALDGLEHMGCVVDTRGEIHEKVVIIDDEIVWFGSLNPLSHTSNTTEVMARIEGAQVATQLAAFLALNKGARPDTSEGLPYQAENPRCPLCGSRASYKKGKFGGFWDCEAEGCVWTESYDRPKARGRETVSKQSTITSFCPDCGKALVERAGRFGQFVACSGFPGCKYIEKKRRGPGPTKRTR